MTDEHYTPQVRTEYALMDILHGIEYLQECDQNILKEYKMELTTFQTKLTNMVGRLK